MRALSLVALVAALALPHVAAAQTPSVTPTPAPVALTFRFDCDSVPWSCGDGPNDVRWQLYEGVSCQDGLPASCRYEKIGPARPGQTVTLWPGHRYKLFLAPNLDRSDRIGRSCNPCHTASAPCLVIYSECTVYDTACAGPQNWQLYADTSAGMLQGHKHIGECSRYALFPQTAVRWMMDWGLPGELAAAPTAAATMTVPPTASPTPTVGIPTEVPTVAVTQTASPTTTDAPTRAASATRPPTPTVTPTRGVLLLPMLGR